MKCRIGWHWLAIAAVVVVAGSAAAEKRTWSDSTGKFKVEAEYLSTKDGDVVLRRADGKEITVPLKRLSAADQAFIQKQTASKPAVDVKSASKPASDAKSASKDIRDLAGLFYRDLRTKERDKARGALTDAAQALAKDGKSPLAELPTPDDHVTAIKPGSVKIDGAQAEIPVQVRSGGKFIKTTLHLRNESDQWRVVALSATYPDGEKTINFEEAPAAAAAGQQPADPLAALVGKTMDLAGYTLDGKALDMSAYKGKVVLVDFWATWCGPCRAEIPNVLENWNKYHNAGFEVIALSIDDDLNALKTFVGQESPPWTVIADRHPKNRNSMQGKYGITGIPAFVLIGKDGKVADVNCRGQKLGQDLAQLLSGPNNATKTAKK